MSNQMITDRILEIVRNARAEAKSAENQFDRRNQDIQRKASYSINLFGGTATSQVADIARDARRACDDLYTAYQSLVRVLDEQCRPLLEQDPGVHAVREVRDLITWLNNESEIENNFTASLNGRGLGDVASARYFPSIDSKMIQRYWENKYSMWPGRAEQEAKARQEAAERRRVQQEAQQEAMRKAREQAEKEYAVKLETYNKEHRAWEEQKRSVERKRVDLLEEGVKKERDRLMGELDARYHEVRDKLQRQRDELRVTKKKAEDLLPTLGFFAFGQKAQTKKRIETSATELDSLNAQLRQVDEHYKVRQQQVQKQVSDFRNDLKKKVERENPIPTEPRKPVMSVPTPASSVGVSAAVSAVQQAILDFMVPGERYTITDIIQGCPACADLTNQRVSAILRSMMGTHIKRIEDQRFAYFMLNDSVPSAPVAASTRAYEAETRPTAQQVVNEAIKEAILDSMEDGRLYTITDIINACPACADLTNLRVSAIVRTMIGSSVERIEEKRKAYFRKL